MVDNLWSDVEVKSSAADRLNRNPFSQKAAELINSIPEGAESTVFGIIGAWGSGKSSVLNLIEEHLSEDIQAVRFSPWAVTDESGLLAEFFTTLLSASPQLSKKKNRALVVSLAKKGLPALGAIPVAGAALRDTANSLLTPENWNTQFEKVQRILESEGARILMVVDDVDRLHGEEVLTLIKTIRMLGRFNNVHYLLAYDHEALCDALEPRVGNRDRASAYLEKIVQYPLTIPAAQRRHLKLLLDEGLDELPAGTLADRNSGARLRFDWFYEETASKVITTLRSVKRFVSQASHYVTLVGVDEVDVADFLALTFLRLHFPPVYEKLRLWKEDLTGQKGAMDPTYKAPDENEWRGRFGALLDDPTKATLAAETMKFLFPEIFRGNFSPEVPRMSHPDYFDRYLVFGVPEGDVSDLQVDADIQRVLASGPVEFSVDDFRSTFTSETPGTSYASVEKAASITRPMADDPATAARLTSFVLWLASVSSDATSPAAFDMWTGELLAKHPGFDDLDQLNGRLRSLPEIRVLGGGLNRASTLLEHVYDQDELAVPAGAALSQIRHAVAGVAIGQLIDYAKSMPSPRNSRRFFDTYSLIKDCGGLQAARREVSAALENGNINAVLLVSFFATFGSDSGGMEDGGGSLSPDRLVQLVDLDTLRSLEIRAPSQEEYGVTAVLQRHFDKVASLFSHWRETLENS